MKLNSRSFQIGFWPGGGMDIFIFYCINNLWFENFCYEVNTNFFEKLEFSLVALLAS